MPGEQPEVLGLEWSESPCNSEPVNLAFELYGGGTFGWTVSTSEGTVQQGAGSGEIEVSELPPALYTLDVVHACLEEEIELSLLDPNAPTAWANWNNVVVANDQGVAQLQAEFTGQAESHHWLYLGEAVSVNGPLSVEVSGGGLHEVVLVTESNGCVASRVLEFEVVSDMQDQVRSDWSVQLNADH